jgi:hypothetical protein
MAIGTVLRAPITTSAQPGPFRSWSVNLSASEKADAERDAGTSDHYQLRKIVRTFSCIEMLPVVLMRQRRK